MQTADERSWRIATVTAPGGHRFGVAIGKDTRADTDPVALAYGAGSLAPVGRLLAVAACVLAPGDRVLDLGAHLGGFALSAAARGCAVLAVEASPRNAALLRRSAEHNHFAALEVVEAAVAAHDGDVEFAAHGPWGHVAIPAVDLPIVTVRAVRVDALLAARGWGHVAFVKIDVEGSEIRALQGMANLLRPVDAPLVWFESNRHTLGLFDETPEALKAELRRFGYTIHRVTWNGLTPVDASERQRETVVDYLAAKELPARLRPWRGTLAQRVRSRVGGLIRAKLRRTP